MLGLLLAGTALQLVQAVGVAKERAPLPEQLIPATLCR